VGFREINVQFQSPVSDEGRLQYLPSSKIANEIDQMVISIYNQNIDKLNKSLFGAQDYFLVGKK
jgi:O-antigen chain-terminating methyltransferase